MPCTPVCPRLPLTSQSDQVLLVMGFACCRNYWKPQLMSASGLADGTMQVRLIPQWQWWAESCALLHLKAARSCSCSPLSAVIRTGLQLVAKTPVHLCSRRDSWPATGQESRLPATFLDLPATFLHLPSTFLPPSSTFLPPSLTFLAPSCHLPIAFLAPS